MQPQYVYQVFCDMKKLISVEASLNKNSGPQPLYYLCIEK